MSLDEGTCAYKDRFCTNSPNKPHKWGIKIYQVCDSDNGYFFNLKAAGEPGTDVKTLVLDLLQDYLEKGHELYVDWYYTSVALFQRLWRKRNVGLHVVKEHYWHWNGVTIATSWCFIQSTLLLSCSECTRGGGLLKRNQWQCYPTTITCKGFSYLDRW